MLERYIRCCVVFGLVLLAGGENGLVVHTEEGVEEFAEGVDYKVFPTTGGQVLEEVPLVQMWFGCHWWRSPFTVPTAVAVQRGRCTFQDKLDTAVLQLNMSAVLIYNYPQEEGLVLTPYITHNYGVPVIFLTHEAGLRLAHATHVSIATAPVFECPRTYDPPRAIRSTVVHANDIRDLNVSKEILRAVGRAGDDYHKLRMASFGRSVPLVRHLLARQGVTYDARNQVTGETALHSACSSNDMRVAVAKRLIISGADIEAVDHRGHTPLFKAVLGDYLSAVRMLLEHGADVDHLDRSKVKPLWYACQKHASLCDLLLQFGADPNYRSAANGMTALHSAVSRADAEVVRVLLEWGADKTIRTSSGRLPLDLVPSKKGESVRALLEVSNLTSSSDESGFDFSPKLVDSRTGLWLTVLVLGYVRGPSWMQLVLRALTFFLVNNDESDDSSLMAIVFVIFTEWALRSSSWWLLCFKLFIVWYFFVRWQVSETS